LKHKIRNVTVNLGMGIAEEEELAEGSFAIMLFFSFVALADACGAEWHVVFFLFCFVSQTKQRKR
jgi:hypothetical protein